MIPIPFEQANVYLEAEDGLISDTLYNNYVGYEFKNDVDANCLLTLWQPSKEDLEALNRGEAIRLLQIGGDFNKIMLYTKENT